MSFFVAACVLLLALIASIVLDNTGVSRRRFARRAFPALDAW